MQIINTSDGLFRDGNPASGEPGTIVPAAWLNSMQSELLSVLSANGITPDPAKTTQLLDAVKKLAWNSTSARPSTLAGYGITDAAPINSPVLTGTPTAPSAASGTNTTQLATTAFVQTSVNGRLVKSVAGGANVTLTATEAGYAILEFNGALTANIAVIVPNAPGQWVVRNATSGAYTFTVKTTAGTGTTVVQGSSEALWCDGSNVMEADASKADRATTLTGYGITDAAPLNSPALTGTPTGPTAAAGDNSAKLATTSFVAGITGSSGPVMFRNRLINGNFDIWQRGASFTTPANGSYVADRWSVYYDGTPGTFTVDQRSWALGSHPLFEKSYYLRWSQTIASSGSTLRQLAQKIESVRTLAGKQASVSFVAWADSARSVQITLLQSFGTGGTPSAYVPTPVGTVNLTTTPTRYVLPAVTLPGIAGKTLGATDDGFLSLVFSLPNNSTFIFNVDCVQVEEGTVATAIEQRPIQTELAQCQRYYEKSYDLNTAPGTDSPNGHFHMDIGTPSTGALGAQVTFAVKKRATPAITGYTTNGIIGKLIRQTTDVTAEHRFQGLGGFQFFTLTGMSATVIAGHWTADAEL